MPPRAVLLAVTIAASGCAFDRGGVPGDGAVPDAEAGTIDAATVDADPIDADPGAPDAMGCVTWDALNVGDPCDDAFGTPGALSLGAGRNRYDTDTGVLTTPGGTTSTPPSVLLAQASGPELRVLVLASLLVPTGTALVASGSRPLAIIVHGDATITGTLDVSATVGDDDAAGVPGAGGDDATACASGAGDPGTASIGAGGAGGGGGGGYGGDGGDGGDGNGAGKGDKGGKGGSNGSATIVPLRGGCPGAAGGDDFVGLPDNRARVGNGGGGFELTARDTINVTGTIAASDSGGGSPALANAGGSGAGSGGAILLDGDDVSVSASAKLCANGGGGGEGGQTLSASEVGEDAACVEAPRADGGAIEASGGDGGDGGDRANDNATNASNGTAGAAGGGGGGSVGRIRVRGRTTRAVDAAAIVSPDAAM